ncbi:MAG: FadR/GntR family transcriptional regulator [Devosia sp.]
MAKVTRPAAKPQLDPVPAEAGAAARSAPAGFPLRSDMPFRRSIQEYLVHRLGSDIVRGVYPPGSLLPNEADIGARLEVSRTTLREAYSVLASKSLIVARQRVGTRVRPRAEWNMLDSDVLAWHLEAEPTEAFVSELFTLRQMIEPEAAALAAEVTTPGTVERISAAYDAMERAKEGSGDLVGADLQFHIAILDASGNRFISALSALIHASLVATFRLTWEGASYLREERLFQHRDVLHAIRDHNPAKARARARVLLTDSMADARGFLRQRESKK